MADTLIPVGSVVRLEDASALTVVLGYFVDDGEQLYDYLLAPYPAGLDDPNHALLANADAIVEVVARGYLDDAGEQALAAAAGIMAAKEKLYVTVGKALEESGTLVGEGEAFTME